VRWWSALRTVQSALVIAEDGMVSAAILDIRVGDDTVEPIARRLAQDDVPFVFYTGQSTAEPLRTMWPDCKILAKPALPGELVAAVAAAMRKRRRDRAR
jgi:DNA-binding response OmpR family regulator